MVVKQIDTKITSGGQTDFLIRIILCASLIAFLLFSGPSSEEPVTQTLDPFFGYCQDKGRPLPKFGEWDVNDPASAEGFTVIFNKARDEKKTGGKPESPSKNQPTSRPGMEPTKSQPKKWLCCVQAPDVHS